MVKMSRQDMGQYSRKGAGTPMRLQEEILKRTGNLYNKLISDDNLRLALLEVNATHRWYPRHRPNKTVQWVEMDVDARVRELRRIISGMVEGSIRLPRPKKRTC